MQSWKSAMQTAIWWRAGLPQKPHTVRGLELEKAYTLTETRAPDGYTEAESIVFKLVQEGNEQSNIVYVKTDDDWVKLTMPPSLCRTHLYLT